jgi:tetratricopeptide (TPR) repeat protein
MSIAARRALIAVAALVLAWRVLQLNIVQYDDTGRPRFPVIGASSPGASADREALFQVLHSNPGEVGALVMLARQYESSGDAAQARRVLTAALQLAPSDRDVLAAAAEFDLRSGDFASALPLLDRLAGAYPEARPGAFDVFSRLLSEGREAATWSKIVARKPAWLGPFILSSCERGTDPAILVALLLGRTRTPSAESACVIDRLRDSDRWPQAYQAWLNTLPPERLSDVGFVFNGSFEFAPSGQGFDWRPARGLERDSGHSVEMPQAQGVSGKRALRVSFNGKRQSGVPIAQYVALLPGRYELSGLVHVLSITAGRGVQWTLRCVKAGAASEAVAASERFVGSSEWRRFAFEISVPAACQGQILQLEAIANADGAAFLSGSIWFDDLVLHRL